MKKTIVAAALATVIASPAFAQSYDPSVGSGNIAARISAPASRSRALDAYARVPHGAPAAVHSFTRGGTDPDPNIRFQLNRASQQGQW
jgi:hypothetical protein